MVDQIIVVLYLVLTLFVGIIAGFMIIAMGAGKEKQNRYIFSVKRCMVAWPAAAAVYLYFKKLIMFINYFSPGW